MDAGQRRALQELLTRLADGDRAAFPPAFALLWPVTRAFARSFLRDDAWAEDAAQQAMANLFFRAAEFDPSREALPWTLAIVAYECRTLRQRARRRREAPLEGSPEALAPGPSPEESAERADLERAARAVLVELAPADVEAILAHVGEGRRPSLPAATFRKRVERALRRLRQAWRQKHGTL